MHSLDVYLSRQHSKVQRQFIQLNVKKIFTISLTTPQLYAWNRLKSSRQTDNEDIKTKELDNKLNILELYNSIVADAFDEMEKATRLLIHQIKVLWHVGCECEICGFCYYDPVELQCHKKKHLRNPTGT